MYDTYTQSRDCRDMEAKSVSCEAALNEFKSAWPGDTKRMAHEINEQQSNMNYCSVNIYYAPPRVRHCANF